MIEDLKPYPEYKDSGLPWLGEVPAHWELKRLGSVFEERGESNEKRGVTDILSVLKDRGVIPYSEKGRIGNKASDDIGRYKIVRPDDLVLNSMNVIIGSLGISCYTGCLSPVYYVLSQREQANNVRYLELFFQNKQFHESLVRIGNGILAHRMRIPMEKLKAELITLPPPEEQAAIARFLAWATNRLDRAIGAKRRIIALLQEQKQTIIHRAVTRGLDPSVPLKDSGIPWLGQIPEHWETSRIKSLLHEIDWRTTTGQEELLSLRMHAGLVPHNDVSSVPIKPENLIGFKKVAASQLVMNRMRAAIGMFAISMRPGLVSPDYAIFEQVRPLDLRYFLGLFRTPGMCRAFRIESKGLGTGASGFMRLYSDRFGAIKVPVPPIDEQFEIAEAIRSETAGIDCTERHIESEITLLREYRTRLIADVVTGKLDVREVAAGLPEDVEPSIQSDAASYDGDDAEDDPGSDPIDTEED